MAEGPKAQTTALVTAGMALVAVALVSRDSLEGREVFGLPGDWITGFLLGASVVILLAAVVKSRKAS